MNFHSGNTQSPSSDSLLTIFIKIWCIRQADREQIATDYFLINKIHVFEILLLYFRTYIAPQFQLQPSIQKNNCHDEIIITIIGNHLL